MGRDAACDALPEPEPEPESEPEPEPASALAALSIGIVIAASPHEPARTTSLLAPRRHAGAVRPILLISPAGEWFAAARTTRETARSPAGARRPAPRRAGTLSRCGRVGRARREHRRRRRGALPDGAGDAVRAPARSLTREYPGAAFRGPELTAGSAVHLN